MAKRFLLFCLIHTRDTGVEGPRKCTSSRTEFSDFACTHRQTHKQSDGSLEKQVACLSPPPSVLMRRKRSSSSSSSDQPLSVTNDFRMMLPGFVCRQRQLHYRDKSHQLRAGRLRACVCVPSGHLITINCRSSFDLRPGRNINESPDYPAPGVGGIGRQQDTF